MIKRVKLYINLLLPNPFKKKGKTVASCISFFFKDDKSNLSYTKGKGADLRRLRDNPKGTKPPSNQTGAQHTRLNFFLETNQLNAIFWWEARFDPVSSCIELQTCY